MTRKDYEKLAESLGAYRHIMAHGGGSLTPVQMVDMLVNDVVRVLAADNPRFDPARFVKAVNNARN